MSHGLTWVIPLQQVPAVERSAFGVAHLQSLLQQPLGDVTLADACVPEARRVILANKTLIYFTVKKTGTINTAGQVSSIDKLTEAFIHVFTASLLYSGSQLVRLLIV